MKPIKAMLTDEKTALATLASDADVEKKARACQQLAIVGGVDAVPALAALLGDEKLASRARSALENIKDVSATEALRKALTLKGGLLAGVIVSLGARREASVVPELSKLAGSPEPEIRDAALSSLGQIAAPEAVKNILRLLTNGRADHKIPAAHAALAAARRLDPAGASALKEAVRKADVPDYIKKAAGAS